MIFLDMDGVVADFVSHIRAKNIPYNNQWGQPRETWTQETLESEAIKEAAMHSRGFWTSIPLMPGAKELYDLVNPLSPSFLTAKPRENSPDWIAEEKLEYVRTHLDPTFPEEKMFCCNIGEKGKWAGPGLILIDDDLKRNGKEWSEAGGVFLHYEGPQHYERIAQYVAANH